MDFCAKIKSSYDCDVLVVGGGVAGIAAAEGAAKNGASVILAESGYCLGGTVTAGLVGPFMTCYDRSGETQIIRGVFDEIIRELATYGGVVLPEECRKRDSFSGYKLHGHLGTVPFDREVFKYVTEQRCVREGVKILYHHLFVGAKAENGKIRECFFATKNGFYSIRCKCVVDCTGDASVVYLSGGKTLYSDESGNVQPASTFFLVDDVNKAEVDEAVAKAVDEEGRYFKNYVDIARAKGDYHIGTVHTRLYEQPHGVWAVNMTKVNGDLKCDPQLVSEAEISARAQIPELMDFLHKYIPGFSHAKLIASGELGVRESRRIEGEYILTGDDLKKSVRFDDTIALAANSFDMHTSGKTNYLINENAEPYSIPYRALVSKSFDNVFSAGKSVSADRVALSAVRVVPPAMATGQAAGTAAALCAQSGVKAKELNYETLRTALECGGVYFG